MKTVKEILASPSNTRGAKYNPDGHYCLVLPGFAGSKLEEDYEVLVDEVPGDSGERFQLLYKAPKKETK